MRAWSIEGSNVSRLADPYTLNPKLCLWVSTFRGLVLRALDLRFGAPPGVDFACNLENLQVLHATALSFPI